MSSAAPTNVSRTVAAPALGDVIPASQQPRAKAGRLPVVDKEASDDINIIILQAILAENRMVRCFLGHKGGSKYFMKDTMTSLMNGLAKHSHPVVKGLSESALNKRIKVAVDETKEMALSSDREKLAKLKDNGNENNVDTVNVEKIWCRTCATAPQKLDEKLPGCAHRSSTVCPPTMTRETRGPTGVCAAHYKLRKMGQILNCSGSCVKTHTG